MSSWPRIASSAARRPADAGRVSFATPRSKALPAEAAAVAWDITVTSRPILRRPRLAALLGRRVARRWPSPRPAAGRRRNSAAGCAGRHAGAQHQRVAGCACTRLRGLRNYVGTFVVSSNTGAMSSARIWHACEGDQQVERVESLTGAPRSTFRRNEEVVTFLPESRVVAHRKAGIAGPVPQPAQAQRDVHPRVLRGAPGRAPTGSPDSRPTSSSWRPRTTCGSAIASGARRRAGWW